MAISWRPTPDQTARWTRRVRGAVRLSDPCFDAGALASELARFEGERWHARLYGEGWADLSLLRRTADGERRHPMLADCPALLEVLEAFPAKPIDFTFARMVPGAAVHDHRDFSGNEALGVARFHIPVVTHEDVAFYVSGTRLFMAPGAVWQLDTSYLHRVENHSDITRVHIILDVEMNDAIRAMLPPTDLDDVAHKLFFAGLCVARGGALAVRNPRAAWTRLDSFVKLRVLKRSVLSVEDDST